MDLSTIEPLYDKKAKCIYCQNTFTTKKIRSRFVKPLKIEQDFGPLFKEGEENNPLLYYVTVCSECGFSFTEDFSHHISEASRKKVQKEITEKMDKVTDFWGKRNVNQAVRAYKLAIYSAQLVLEKHIVFANLCLRLAWLYRGIGNQQEEKRFLELAVSEFEKSYIHTDFKTETTPEVSILYLIGEINRRLGNYNEAITYFTAVAEHPERSRYTKYVNYAREQWQLAAREYREKKG
ncbi:MAG: hypothetical protein AWM53_01100 [Candidatus Dichloromethanomonas elyunquensis]|nr:MAG: hypothetical protein AWM53_01100 [Candidatus Dichloromethanomonas elyunquensis]